MKKYGFANVSARPFPTLLELDNKWIFGDVKAVINVSEREDPDCITEYIERGIEYSFFPLKEEGEDMGWANICLAVRKLALYLRKNIPTIVHCECGNNRSRLVVEAAYYILIGKHYEDEYKGSFNHLIYNSEHHHLPFERDRLETELHRMYMETSVPENIEKIIFLDFDGVLTTFEEKDSLLNIKYDGYGEMFRENCVNQLRRIVDETGAKIVVSSSWKLACEGNSLKWLFDLWNDRNMPGNLIGATPNLNLSDLSGTDESVSRKGMEIQAWINKNISQNTKYAIIDDEEIAHINQLDRFVKTELSEGLTKEKADLVIEILRNT